jgi:hypothetical protein
MTKSVVVIGPYIGDLEQELFAFRPHARYITSSVEAHEIFISSHFNRSFLYDWIPEDNFIPVFESLTREETKQHGYLHDDVTRTDYSQLVKHLKTNIKERMGKVDMEVYSPPYIKSINTISIYQKEFSTISFPKADINKSNNIVFVSDQSDESEEIYNTLKDLYDIIVLGNMSNGIEHSNVLLKTTDYYINGYVTMMNYINNSTMLVTNCPVWAMVGNLLQKHMVFWGNSCSQFKPEGIYGFYNPNAVSVDVSMKSVIGEDCDIEFEKFLHNSKEEVHCPKCGQEPKKLISSGNFKVNGFSEANGYAGKQ